MFNPLIARLLYGKHDFFIFMAIWYECENKCTTNIIGVKLKFGSVRNRSNITKDL